MQIIGSLRLEICLIERVRRANAACNKYGAKNVI